MFKPSIADKIAAARQTTTNQTDTSSIPLQANSDPGSTNVQQPDLTNINQASPQVSSQVDLATSETSPSKIPKLDTSTQYPAPQTTEFTGDVAATKPVSKGFMASLSDAAAGAAIAAVKDSIPMGDISTPSHTSTDPEIQKAPKPQTNTRPNLPAFNPASISNRSEPTDPQRPPPPAYTSPTYVKPPRSDMKMPKFRIPGR